MRGGLLACLNEERCRLLMIGPLQEEQAVVKQRIACLVVKMSNNPYTNRGVLYPWLSNTKETVMC